MSKKAAHLRKVEQQQEAVSLDFAKHLFEKQAKGDLGYCVAQPLNSVMFNDKASPFKDISEMYACRKKQQVDQCAHGCIDPHGTPVKKATAFLSNVKHYHAAKRCDGHKGRNHVTQQGRNNDVTPVAHTVIYPQRLCRAVVDDVWKFVRASGLNFPCWPSELMLHSFSGYKCERCQLGRAALPFMEHTLVPGNVMVGALQAKVTDPVIKTMFQQILQKEMNVKGIVCALRPFHCMVPEPQLSSRAAPLRPQISGNIKTWKVHELEDFRMMCQSQQHQKIDEVDWLI
eukprot:s6242_g7.t1